MTEQKMCIDCHGTGLTMRGFCQICKGEGYRQVLETIAPAAPSPAAAFQSYVEQQGGSIDPMKLFSVIKSHTTKKQLTDIMNDFIRLTP